MQTDVRALSEVDYALDVHVPADALTPRVTAALKKQRAQLNLKGFRPGKVPLSVARKMVGPQVAIGIAEEIIAEAYREAVVDKGKLDVIGQPRLDQLDFDPGADGADLRATVAFGVRPEFSLADMAGVPVTRLVRVFNDEDVDADVQRRIDLAARLVDADEGTALGENDVAVVDVVPVDEAGELIGPVQRDAEIVLANPELRKELKEALLGQTAGQTVRVAFPHLHGEDEGHNPEGEGEADHDDRTDRYRVTITRVRHRVLPDLDASFIKGQTGGRSENLDDLKVQAREELEEAWKRRSDQALESRMVEQFVSAHAFAVPASLIEGVLDQMVEEFTQKGEGRFPEGFNMDAFREERRPMAEAQVRWLLIKDKLVREEGLEVTSEDFEAEFAKMAGDEMELALVRQYFEQQPQLLEQVGERMLNRRVFGALEGRFDVVEKTREDLEREAGERRAAQGSGASAEGGSEGEPAAEASEAGEADDAKPAKKARASRKKKED